MISDENCGLQWLPKDGLYHFSNSATAHCWWKGFCLCLAQHFGHLRSIITHNIISRFSLPASSKSWLFVLPVNLERAVDFLLFLNTSYLPLEMVYSDVWGPTPIVVAKYCVHLVDVFSRFIWIRCNLKFQNSLLISNKVRTYFDQKIRNFHVDRGTKLNHCILYLCIRNH